MTDKLVKSYSSENLKKMNEIIREKDSSEMCRNFKRNKKIYEKKWIKKVKDR